MQTSETIVGFDARDYRDDFASLWPQARRDQFLYRLDVRKVLSVDSRVWPNIFTATGRAMRPDQAAVQDLWAYAASLRRVLGEMTSARPLPAFRTVAITLVDEGTIHSHPSAMEVARFVEPKDVAPEWELVGYDVADAWLLSAVANCGFMPGQDDVESMRNQWGPLLNEFHLFRDVDAASAFRRMSDVRLASDHAPTFVYGIRILK